MEYLAQWDYGETTEDEAYEGAPSGKDLTEYPYCFQGNDRSYETDEYVMVWSPSFSVAGLWRKIAE